MNRPQDFQIARDEGWYRIPEKKAGRGAFFEYVAFYFTAAFAEYKYAVHYYARRLGHELVARCELLPDEPDHPRAGEPYYKLQLGPLQKREPPILSLRWRRISFIHTKGLPGALCFSPAAVAADLDGCLRTIGREVERRGGVSYGPRREGEESSK